MSTYYVGLSGKAGSGKDTAAKFLKEALEARGKRVETLAFADPIRWMLLSLGVPQQYMMNRDLKEEPIPGFNGCSYRQLAQTLGTEWGRHCLGNEFWLKQVERRLSVWREIHRSPDVLIISDVRMPNEAAWILARGGMLAHVVRPHMDPVREHESEGYELPFTLAIHNDSDLISLRSRSSLFANTVLNCIEMARDKA